MLTPLPCPRLRAQGETSVRGEAAAPEWNEQLSFVELFPPLTRGLRLQLRDDAPLVDVALATHVLDLRQISHPGRAGERSCRTPDASAWALSAPGPAPTAAPSLRSESQGRPGTLCSRRAPPFGDSPVAPRLQTPPLVGSVGRILTKVAHPVTTPALCSVQIDVHDTDRSKCTLSIRPSP